MKKIFIIILLLLFIFLINEINLHTILKDELSYNVKLLLQFVIIITCLLFVLKLCLQLVENKKNSNNLKIKKNKKERITIEKKELHNPISKDLENKENSKISIPTKDQENVHLLQRWREQSKKEKEEYKNKLVTDYNKKIKRVEESRLRKLQKKEEKLILRRIENEKLEREKDKHKQNHKSRKTEPKDKVDNKLSWFERQEEKLKLRELEKKSYSNNLERLKLLIKNRSNDRIEPKKNKDENLVKPISKLVKKTKTKNPTKIKETAKKKAETGIEIKIKKVKPVKAKKSVTKKEKQSLKPVSNTKRPTLKEKNKTTTKKRVNFTTNKIIESNFEYPVIKKPKYNSIIRSFRRGRNNRKGFKEEELHFAIKQKFGAKFEVIDNAILAVGKGINPFEPDIAMVSKGEKNIFIDIEIDEPYAGINRKLTHCYLEDKSRDNYFTDRGWFVIRFSEYQVHHELQGCLLIIESILSIIDNNSISAHFSTISVVNKEKCWNNIQASIWERENYRENYLNHTFRPYKEIREEINTELTSQEKLEESEVKPEPHTTVKKTTSIYTPKKRQQIIQKKVIKPIYPPIKRVYNSNNTAISTLIEMAVNKGFDIEMNYTNWKGEISIRKVSDLDYTSEFLEKGYDYKQHFKGYCHKRLEERSFKIDRISYLKLLN